MKRPTILPTAPHRLIVEGINDKWSVINLLAQHGCDWDAPTPGLPYIDAAGSVDQALDALPVAVKSYPRVGVVIDADLDAGSRWTAVRGRLADAFPNLPKEMPRGGLVDESGSRRIGVWLMPDNLNVGKLEDFLGHLVPVADTSWAYALEASRAARNLGAPFAPKDEAKARIHTWLAWRETPGMPFGQAITARALASDTPLALGFVAWFRRLYGDP